MNVGDLCKTARLCSAVSQTLSESSATNSGASEQPGLPSGLPAFRLKDSGACEHSVAQALQRVVGP